MTSEVSAPDSSATETIRRIGPALVVGSALGSTLGIIIAQFLDDLGDGILALILGAEDAVLYNNRVEFSGASPENLAWAGGFILLLVVGFIMLFSYPTARGHGVARLTLLWTVLHILRQAFFQAAVLPFDSESQLALAYEELDAIAGLDLVIAAAGGVGLLLIALSAASAFLAFTPHHKLINNGRKRLIFALWIALIPAVASAFLAIPFFLPVSSDVVRSLPWTAVIFIATLAAAPGTTAVHGPEDHRQTPFPWGLLTTLALVLVFELAVLDGGVAINPTEWGQ